MIAGEVQMREPCDPYPVAIQLTERQRAILEEMVRSRRQPHDEGQHTTIILRSAENARNRHIAVGLVVSDVTVQLWCQRWAKAASQLAAAEPEADEQTLRGLIQHVLHDAPRGGRPATFTPEQICQIVVLACEAPAEPGRPVPH
jgi:putative transposase